MSERLSKKFFSNASWIMIGRIFQLGLTFITTMLVTRYLGPTEFGKLTYIYSYVQLFIPVCAMGMNDIIVKELIENKENNDEILGSATLIRIISSLISMFLSVFIVSIFNNNPLYKTIALLQSFSLLFQSFEGIMYYYQSKLLSKKTGIVYALAYILTALFRLCCIYTNKDIKWFAFAMSLDYIMIAVLLISTYLFDNYKFKFSFNCAKKLLSKSFYYAFAGILVVIYGKVTDTLLLGRMINETSVGYYSAAITLCNAWPFILTAIIDSASPIIIDMYKTDKTMFEKRLKQLYAAVFYIGVVVAFLITVLSDLIISILYGKEYMPASMPLKIACWSSGFAYIGVSRTIWIQCENKIHYETIISLFGAIISIVLNYILIKNLGINGAAIALVLTQLLTNFVFLFFVKDLRANAKLILDAIMLKDVLK